MSANQPVSPNAATVQGASPDGSMGYPVNVVPTPGAAAFDVNITGGGGGAVTIADGADVCEGATTDAEVRGNIAGTVSAKLRGINHGLDDLIIANNNDGIGVKLRGYNLGPGTSQIRSGTPFNTADKSSQMFVVPMVMGNYQVGGASNYWYVERTPETFKSAQANAAGATLVWAPTPPTRVVLMRYMIAVTGDATLAAPGILTVSLLDGAAAIGQDHDIYVPAVAPAAPFGTIYLSPWIDLGNGVFSAAPGTNLNVNLSAALVTGNVRVIVCGIET